MVYRQLAAPEPIGRVLDNAVALFKASFVPVLLLALASALARSVPILFHAWSEFLLADGPLMDRLIEPGRILGAVGDALPVFLVSWLVGVFLALGVIVQMDAIRRSSTVPWPAALAAAFRRLPAALICCLVYLLVLFLVSAIAVFLGAAVVRALYLALEPGMVEVLAILIGMAASLAAAIPLTVLAVYWSLALPLIVMNDLGAFAALRRSWNLVRGHWWRTLAILTLAMFFILVVASLASLADVLVVSIAHGGLGVRVPVFALNALAGTVTTPLLVAALLAMLADLELRRGGADLGERMEQSADE